MFNILMEYMTEDGELHTIQTQNVSLSSAGFEMSLLRASLGGDELVQFYVMPVDD